jgi:hypothetical protein
MYDFASGIAPRKKLPSLALGFKPLDPTVLIRHLPAPKCVKLAMGCGVYFVIRILNFISHETPLPFATKAVQKFL